MSNHQNLDFQQIIEYYISCLQSTKCRSWNKIEDWTQSNFDELSRQIFTDTKQNISASTLKRVLRHKIYKRKPYLVNLNVLAQYIGYSNWSDFTEKNYKNIIDSDIIIEEKKVIFKPSLKVNKKKILLISVIIILLPILYSLIEYFIYKVNPKTIIFYIEKPAKKFPDNFKINFDLSKVRHIKNAYITIKYPNQKPSDTIRLDIKDRWKNKEYIFLQNNPGKYYLQLIINNKLVAQDSVNSYTNNWIAEINEKNNSNLRIHFPEDSIIKNGVLNLDISKILRLQINPNYVKTSFFNCNSKFEKITSTNFIFESKVKNDQTISVFGEGKAVIFTLMFNKGFISFNLLDNRYISHAFVLLNNTSYSGKENTKLASLCNNMNNWQIINIKSINQLITFFINGKEVFNLPFKENLGNMNSIKISTSGMVDYVKLFDENNSMIYFDDFIKE